MDILDQFVNYMKLDDEKRILVSQKEALMPYLEDPKSKAMLKSSIESILGSDFKQLEVGKNVVRVTVAEGTEEKNLELVKTELMKNIQMAMQFMGGIDQ